MMSVEVPQIHGITKAQETIAQSLKMPDHIMQGVANLAAYGRRIAAEVATARAQRRTAFKIAVGLLKQRHQAMTDGLDSVDLDQISAEVAHRVDTITGNREATHHRRFCQRSTPTTHRVTALVTAAHAPPTRITPETYQRRVLML
jgi:hypothetical protein